MKIHRGECPLWLVASWLLVGPGFGPASAQQLGTEFPVNTYTTFNQQRPEVAADGSGKFVVVWDSEEQDGSQFGVFGQRFDAAGAPAGSEFRVNTYTTNDQKRPAVAADGSGSFIVVWDRRNDGSTEGIFGQRFDSAGSFAGSEFQVNSYTTEQQRYAAVAVDSAGNFVVVWQSLYQDGSYEGVFGQRYDSTGSPVGSEFQVSTFPTGYQNYPSVAADGAGNFVVVWQSGDQDGSGYGVFGQRFDAAGTLVGSEFQVNSFAAGEQRYPAVAADNLGNFVVIWQSNGQDGAGYGVFGQRYDSTGTLLGSEFQVNAFTSGNQSYAALAADDSGDFVVVWSDYQDGSSRSVTAQRFDSAGGKVGSELQLNSYTTSNQDNPAVATDGSGRFVVAWESYVQDGAFEGVFGRQMTLPTIFSDDFETTDTCVWSASVGGGC